jgi:xyloglucan-specific endo-beta-1,4-glucanase
LHSTLFHGFNGVNQSVYSWLPWDNFTSIDTDLSPLIHYLWRKEYISKNTYLGLVQWGSEAMHSAQGHNVTILAEGVSLAVEAGTPQASLGDIAKPDRALVIGLAAVMLLDCFAFL